MNSQFRGGQKRNGLSREAIEFLNGETEPVVEKQLRSLGLGWAYDLRRRWKEMD